MSKRIVRLLILLCLMAILITKLVLQCKLMESFPIINKFQTIPNWVSVLTFFLKAFLGANQISFTNIIQRFKHIRKKLFQLLIISAMNTVTQTKVIIHRTHLLVKIVSIVNNHFLWKKNQILYWLVLLKIITRCIWGINRFRTRFNNQCTTMKK